MENARLTDDNARTRTVRELRELVAALDRRVPQVHRLGEVSIARSAAALKAEALQRIEELEQPNLAPPGRASDAP